MKPLDFFLLFIAILHPVYVLGLAWKAVQIDKLYGRNVTSVNIPFATTAVWIAAVVGFLYRMFG